LAGVGLGAHWLGLHHGDREPWPDERRIVGLARREGALAKIVAARGGAAALAEALQEAWRAFHIGEFPKAIKLGSELGALGATVANKAAAIDSVYSKLSVSQALHMLEAATARGEEAVGQLPKYPNAHYMLALVLGRYSQRISILKALAEGLAGRVRSQLEQTLDLEPRHAEAHVALGLYHAEIINKLGSLTAGFTHNVSSDKAIEHFHHASRLAPSSPIVQMEHANGLLLLDADRYRSQARSLYERAAACQPLDVMEALDVECARRRLTEVKL
jgi:tetratricopeptide (TPR) repeat protein